MSTIASILACTALLVALGLMIRAFIGLTHPPHHSKHLVKQEARKRA